MHKMTLMKPEMLILKKRKLAEDRFRMAVCIELFLSFFFFFFLFIVHRMNGDHEETVTWKPMCVQIMIPNQVLSWGELTISGGIQSLSVWEEHRERISKLEF